MRVESTSVWQTLCELGDLMIGASVLLGIFAVGNSAPKSQGFAVFLQARISVTNALLALGFLLYWQFVFQGLDAYPSGGRSFREEVERVAWASSFANVYLVVFCLTSKTHAFTWALALCCWLGETAALVAFRALRRVLLTRRRKAQRDLIIVGSGARALSLYRRILEDPTNGYRVLGFVDSPNGHVAQEIQARMMGPLDGLGEILMKRVVDQVMIALPVKSCYDQIQRTIMVCEQAGVESEYLPDAFNFRLARPQVCNLDKEPVVRVKVVHDDYRLLIKRASDIAGAVLGLILFSPVLLLTALLVKLSSPGPVLFVQQRYGINKRLFPMLKFRTMVADAEQRQSGLEDRNEAEGPVFKMRIDPRVTPIGRFLRKSSLDELPQLVNVLLGHMSLVGPRPLPNRDVSRFDELYLMRRFSVRPGLTGLWQVSGRSDLGFARWIELDLRYIDTWCLSLDLAILARTIPAVLRGSGAA